MCLIEGTLQSCFAEVVGAHKAITPMHGTLSKTCSAGEGGVDAGDPILFCEQTDVVGALEEHFNEVSSGSSCRDAGGTPGVPATDSKRRWSRKFPGLKWGRFPQRTAG